MIFDVLDQKMKDMKALRQREERRANQKQQEAAEQKYRGLVEEAHLLVRSVNAVRHMLKFPVSEELRTDCLTLLDELESVVSAGYAVQESVEKVKRRYDALHGQMKKAWAEYFRSHTADTLNTLRVIRSIDETSVDRYIEQIEAAKDWSAGLSAFAVLMVTLMSAEELIKRLDMAEETVDFLHKMASGRATAADLSEGIAAWLRKEGLDKKIRLSFLSR